MKQTSSSGPQPIASMRDNLQRYAKLVDDLAGDSLLGLTVYGAVLGTEFDPSKVGAQSALVLSKIDLNFIRRLSEKGATLGGLHITAPVLMTPEYIQRSLDTFPLEMLEIHQAHFTLAGKDYFSSIKIDDSHLRLQCEREFKVVQIRLRQGILAAGGREKVFEALEVDVGLHLLRVLRGYLWLKGKRDWHSRENVLGEVERTLHAELPGLRASIMTPAGHTWKDICALYEDVERLVQVVDVH